MEFGRKTQTKRLQLATICYTEPMSNDSKNSYDKYLAALHAKNITPDTVIADVVKEGTGKDIATKRRIVAGEANEVYDITLSDQSNVILRIARSGHPNFQQEQWALEQVTKVGVPVPEILFVTYKTVDIQELSFCLMKKVAGEPLERGGIDFSALSQDIQKAYIIQAGEILSKIHSIKTQGYGWIIGRGRAEYERPDDIIDELLRRREEAHTIAAAEKIEKNKIDRALEIVESFRASYRKTVPSLNHADYGHKHFMVKDSQIVAILDWGGVRSDTPIYDFACWDYWFGEYIPTAWLKEGYQNKSLFDGDFTDTLHTLRIMKGLEILAWYHTQNYKEAVAQATKKLAGDIAYFR